MTDVTLDRALRVVRDSFGAGIEEVEDHSELVAVRVVDPIETARRAAILDRVEAHTAAWVAAGSPPLPSDPLSETIESLRGRAEQVVEPGAQQEQYRMRPLDWDLLVRDGLAKIEMLDLPYITRRTRIWMPGPTWSAKSIFALWLECRLSRQGVPVAYVSAENPLAEDVRRLERLRPDWDHLRFFHDPGLDLTIPEHVDALIDAWQGVALGVLDTFTAVWSGDENDNRELARFDRDVMQRVVRELGATIVVLDHTGNPQAFTPRKGVHAPRGAASKAQKADVVLVLASAGEATFTVEHAKNRLGGQKEPLTTFRIVDREDGSLDIERIGVAAPENFDREAVTERALAILRDQPDTLTKNALAERLGIRKFDALVIVGDLLRDRRIGPDQPRARLHTIEGDE